ncbi:MAG: NAD(P)-dependent oxidoreductase [Lachnospiraceae bacterium]|nr:NAD(P)-dependent oxidoreductase [Lachnospiraceae bacterium]
MNNVIVTGATSMIGIATIKALILHGVRIFAISRKDSKRRCALPTSELITYIECDLDSLGKINFEEACDTLFHFGWGFTDRTTRDNPYLQLKNVQYTLDAVELAKRSGCKVFIGAGSQAEYGFQNNLIDENAQERPTVCYGITKLAAGKLARKLCEQYEMLCIWTRIFSVYGVNDSDNVMTSYAVNQFLKGEKAYFSKGLQIWNYLFEEDAGNYFYAIGENAKESMILNVAGCENKPLREFVQEMVKALGKDFQYEFSDEESASYNGIEPCINKLESLTGYVPTVSFEEGIKRILERRISDEKN